MGILAIDPELLARYAAVDDGRPVPQDVFINWMGLITSAQLFGSGDSFGGRRFSDLPVGPGGDGVYGSYYEYAALITTIEQASEREQFTAVELGAGWGPWISAAGSICSSLGFGDIRLLGVEADENKCVALHEHFKRNALTDKVSLEVVRAAAWKEDGILQFPKVEISDFGAAAAEVASERDYRGFNPTAYVEVPAKSLATICKDYPRVDYMHWDVQGVEADLVMSDPNLLNDKVVSLCIGTHSRQIEGQLLDLLHKHCWEVVHHDACHYVYDRKASSLLEMLHTDGEIIARNPRLWRGPGV